MTKEEFIRITEMMNGSKEDTELAIGIITQAYNTNIYKRLVCACFTKRSIEHMDLLKVSSTECSLVSIWDSIKNDKNPSKYMDIYKYMVELRLQNMSDLSGLSNVIKNIDITLNEK